MHLYYIVSVYTCCQIGCPTSGGWHESRSLPCEPRPPRIQAGGMGGHRTHPATKQIAACKSKKVSCCFSLPANRDGTSGWMVWRCGGKRVVDLGGWDEDVIGREAEKVCCCFTYSGCTTLRSWMGGVASHTRTPYGPYPWALGFAGGCS